MEEITVELDDETAASLESIAEKQKKTVPEVIRELIEELRRSRRKAEHNPG